MPFEFDNHPEHWYRFDENGEKIARISESMTELIRRIRDDLEFRERFLAARESILNEYPDLRPEERDAFLTVTDDRLRVVIANKMVQGSSRAVHGSIYENAVIWAIVTMLGMVAIIFALNATGNSISSLFHFVSGGVTTSILRPQKECPGNMDQLGRIAAIVTQAQKRVPTLEELKDFGLVARDFSCPHGGGYQILKEETNIGGLRVVCSSCTLVSSYTACEKHLDS